MSTDVAKLIVTQGPLKGTEYLLQEEVNNIGREPLNDIVIKLPALSRRHVRIIVDNQGFLLEDLNSTNGTYLNQERLSGSVWLQHGDEIDLAKSIALIFSTGAPLDIEDTSPIPVTAPAPTIPTTSDATMVSSAPLLVDPTPPTPETSSNRSCLIPIVIFLFLVIFAGSAFLYLADAYAPNYLYCGAMQPVIANLADLLSSLLGQTYQPIACPIP
ncbi:MAG TPA: FHA domain-containing protein [Anaerolineae bacterium]|nr:FHA domain-containing protein [Anaerolineae bacterium]